MKTQCRCCGNEMIQKTYPEPKAGDPFAHLRLISQMMASDVCGHEFCQEQLQFECDEFDQARKGE